MLHRFRLVLAAGLAVTAAGAHGAAAASAPDCIVNATLSPAAKHVLVDGSCTATTTAIVLALPRSSVRAGTILLSPTAGARPCRVEARLLVCATRVAAGHPFRIDLTASRASKAGDALTFTARFSHRRSLALHLEVLAPPADND